MLINSIPERRFIVESRETAGPAKQAPGGVLKFQLALAADVSALGEPEDVLGIDCRLPARVIPPPACAMVGASAHRMTKH